MLQQVLERMDLTLNEAKTPVVDAYQAKFVFLGFEIWMGKSLRTGRHYAHVHPSKESLRKIKDRVTQLTARTRTMIPMDWLVKEVKATVRGCVGYFHFRNCSKALGHDRWHLEERMRTHLRKHYKVRDWKTGYLRFTNRDLYEK